MQSMDARKSERENESENSVKRAKQREREREREKVIACERIREREEWSSNLQSSFTLKF